VGEEFSTIRIASPPVPLEVTTALSEAAGGIFSAETDGRVFETIVGLFGLATAAG
jgi:hypothetical protein